MLREEGAETLFLLLSFCTMLTAILPDPCCSALLAHHSSSEQVTSCRSHTIQLSLPDGTAATVVLNAPDNPVKVFFSIAQMLPLCWGKSRKEQDCLCCLAENIQWSEQDFGKRRENLEEENKSRSMHRDMEFIWRNETGKNSFTSPEDLETCMVSGSLRALRGISCLHLCLRKNANSWMQMSGK